MPVRFEGLDSPDFLLHQVVGQETIRLDQGVHGNDFWQTDFNPESGTYSLTYNLPLDGQPVTQWVLTPIP